MSHPFRISKEIYVPQFENGNLQYMIMEIIANSDRDSGWSVKDFPLHNLAITTEPDAVTLRATDGPAALRRTKVVGM